MKKQLTILIVFSFFSAFLFELQAQNNELKNGQAELETAKIFVEAYEEADWNTMRSLLSDNSTAYNLGGNQSLDRDSHIDFWEEIRMTLNPKIIEKKWLVGEYDEQSQGQWIYNWGKNRNTHTNGISVIVPYHLAFLIINNKIHEVHFYYDRLKIIESMDFELTGPDQEY
ncbi:hypothetical protein OO013_08570 [Mangrovivirga sp. M17]|uniref:Nuclear transport factor 2 family protein n=1 Tax=Mangrovivirga halotolerans TaxID=2993936 RepID=A0ABT3RRL6_9BACT|nr:hypothetical protein [Mangrovivirga halotolerans]MCX2743917.1 hypothetical protein [Mangrovivirga halotolerans]